MRRKLFSLSLLLLGLALCQPVASQSSNGQPGVTQSQTSPSKAAQSKSTQSKTKSA